MHFIQPENRNQTLFFSSLNDFIKKDHPVRIIDAIIRNIIKNNPEKFIYKGKKKVGRKAYSSETMLKLFIYGYLNSISSSRKLEVETHRNIELKWLLGNLQPDHKTIAGYRKDNSDQIKLVSLEFRKFLKKHGYIKGKTVALDGTKIKANTNKNSLTLEQIKEKLSSCSDQLEKYLLKLENEDIEENVLEEIDKLKVNEDKVPIVERIKILQNQIQKLNQAKHYIEKNTAKYISTADPDARLMRSNNGTKFSYNVQAVVDDENHMIAECQVSTAHNDKNELLKMSKSLKNNVDIEPEEMLADAGYYNQKEIKKVEENFKTKCFIPIQKTPNSGEVTFRYDKKKNEYICSQGKRLVLREKNKPKGGSYIDVYQGIECNNCPLRSKCTKSKYGRRVSRYHDQKWRDDYKKRMKSDNGKLIVKKRKQIVEHVFGTVKYWMGHIPLLLRGKKNVQTEMDIYSIAYNLKRLINVENFKKLILSIEKYEWKVSGGDNSLIFRFFLEFFLWKAQILKFFERKILKFVLHC